MKCQISQPVKVTLLLTMTILISTSRFALDLTEVKSLDDLIDFIKRAVTVDDKNRNIYLARSIVKLMYMIRGADAEELAFDVSNIVFQDDVNTFSDMCRLLDIPCEIINGEMKDFTTYRHETYSQKWCAFMSNDRWHLVDLCGILTCTSYKETEGRIVLESEGETVFSKLEQNIGFTSIVFNDFWFCTDPKIFMWYNFPNDTEWLLIDKAKGTKTLEEFESMPFTYLEHHKLGLQFLSKSSRILHSENGRCTISLRAHPNVLRSKCFSYILSFVEGTGDISGIEKDDLPLLVRYAPGIDTISFNIRCPVSGRYVFEVEVKDLDNVWNSNQCFDVIIECEEADPNCQKLPIDAGIVGFGYGHAAKEAGLKNPSKTNPSVKVNVDADDVIMPSVMTFQIDDDQIDACNYSSRLVGVDNREGHTETHVDSVKGKLTVVAGVKTEGEYALSIIARSTESSDTSDTILNYLLTTIKNDDDENQEKLIKKRKLDLILESKIEERIIKKTELTTEINVIEQELKELRKLLKTEEEITDETRFEDEKPEYSDKSLSLPEESEYQDNLNSDAGDEDTDRLTAHAVINTREDDWSSLKVSDSDVGDKLCLNNEKSDMKNKPDDNALESDNKAWFSIEKHASSTLPEDTTGEKKTEEYIKDEDSTQNGKTNRSSSSVRMPEENENTDNPNIKARDDNTNILTVQSVTTSGEDDTNDWSSLKVKDSDVGDTPGLNKEKSEVKNLDSDIKDWTSTEHENRENKTKEDIKDEDISEDEETECSISSIRMPEENVNTDNPNIKASDDDTNRLTVEAATTTREDDTNDWSSLIVSGNDVGDTPYLNKEKSDMKHKPGKNTPESDSKDWLMIGKHAFSTLQEDKTGDKKTKEDIKGEDSSKDGETEGSDNLVWMLEENENTDNPNIQAGDDDAKALTIQAATTTGAYSTNDKPSVNVSDRNVGGKSGLYKKKNEMKSKPAMIEKKQKNATNTQVCCLI